jgi:hypothetical protein
MAKQIVERQVDHDQDVVWLGADRALVMKIERGSVVGFEARALDGRPPAQFLASLAAPEVLVSQEVGAAAPRVRVASRGVESELLELCAMNYRYREEHDAW